MAAQLVLVIFTCMRVGDQLIVHGVVYGGVIRKTFNDAFLIINVCDTCAYSKA